MSMPAGFGNAAAYNLPTSFSGTFQQSFPGQAPFPQPPAYPQQPNGVCPCVDHVDVDISALISAEIQYFTCVSLSSRHIVALNILSNCQIGISLLHMSKDVPLDLLLL